MANITGSCSFFELFLTALQLVEFQGKIGDGVEVILGGGRRAFLPNNMTDYEEVNTTGRRLDGRNLLDEWTAKQPDSKFVWNKKQLDAVDLEKTKHVLGNTFFFPSFVPSFLLRSFLSSSFFREQYSLILIL